MEINPASTAGFFVPSPGSVSSAPRGFQRCQQRAHWALTHTGLTAALALSGQLDKAQQALQRFRAVAPFWSISSSSAVVRTTFVRMMEGLRLAGLPGS